MTGVPLPDKWPAAVDRPIKVLGPNPAMDRLQVVSELHPGGVHRASKVIESAGGKSFIVARSLRRLGAPVTMYGFAGGPVGDFLVRESRALGAHDRHTQISGSTRITPVLIEERSGRSTVINEPGPEISAVEYEEMRQALFADLERGDLVVCTGSAPRGVSSELYAEVVTAVNDAGAYPIVDASGALLANALKAAPWLVKCNAAEFAELRDCDVDDRGSIIDHMRGQLDLGTSVIIITRGQNPTLMATEHGLWQVAVPEIEVVNATGSGDTFLACFVAAVARGDDLAAALIDGTIGGALNATRLEAGLPTDADLSPWRSKLRIEALLTEVQ